MTWTWDAATGVYKNHTLSSKIRHEAIADTVFMRFLRPEPGYGKRKGDTLTITRLSKLTTAGRVSEIARLPVNTVTITTKSVTVTEWGAKIELTEFEKNLTHYDIENEYQRALREQISLTMDKMAAGALTSTPYKYIPVSTGGVFDTDGTASTTADVNMTVADLRNIRDELYGTLKCPPYMNGMYVGILSTKAARGIKNDPEYKDWFAPTDNATFRTSRLKDVENFMLLETNNFEALSNTKGTGSVLGEAVFFGADPAFLAVIEDPELRAGLPEDLGRFKDVGWVGTLEAGLSWDVASTARVVHVTSA